MKRQSGTIVYSPSDLIHYLASPFASWMDRYRAENPDTVRPDEESEDQKLITQTGNQHERTVLDELKVDFPGLVEIPNDDVAAPPMTLSAIESKAPIIYQAALQSPGFAGLADFLLLDESGQYQVWDTKLARSPKPYYAVQLCCYSEMLSTVTGDQMPKKFGIILGSKDRVEFRVEDFIHYYRRIKASFLAMQEGFTGRIADRPDPLPRADHGRWSSHAEGFFDATDNLVRVAGISVGQMKKLKGAGIETMAALSAASGKSVEKLAAESLEKLVQQARLQCQTRTIRIENRELPPAFEILAHTGENGEAVGLATLVEDHPADVFFDMEGYPLTLGGLEYVFGACTRTEEAGQFDFKDWWAHDRDEEKRAFEGFIDWVHARWKNNPGMHIFHYAAYEVSAVRRLSTRHDSRQEEVDELLRNEVFVDLYQVVRHGLRIGERDYSIKTIECLYRPRRATDVASAVDSIVQYARWIESGQPRDWNTSEILRGIRDYNEDDCKSNAELAAWLKSIAKKSGISFSPRVAGSDASAPKAQSPEAIEHHKRTATLTSALRERADTASLVLADLVEFHRREQKPLWWRMFDRRDATQDELRDDPGCIEGIEAHGSPAVEKKSLVQAYRFDPSQECKLAGGEKSKAMFAHDLNLKFTLSTLDATAGELTLKTSQKSLNEKCGGAFPKCGSLIKDEYVNQEPIPTALAEVAAGKLSETLHPSVASLLGRVPPATLQNSGESSVDAAFRIADSISGGCLVIQGPPGTGKTYTGSRVIAALLKAGKSVGVASNSHKAVMNLLSACGDAVKEGGGELQGIKVAGEEVEDFFQSHSGMTFVEKATTARDAYAGGVVGGTAWLFTRPEWRDSLDFLFIDEAGQVPLANAVAMAGCAKSIVLLGDQMQLEQPIQGSHPGDSGLSALQFALKDIEASKTDAPVFHAVVPAEVGLFLGESRRMHPNVCRFISESIYEGRLGSLADCAKQKVALPQSGGVLVTKESGIIFCAIEHDGNVQQSAEEVERVKRVYEELLGREYTVSDGSTRPLKLEDFVFIAPYNAQVRALEAALPKGARVGSVDKFQGQEAPVCILSLCSSYGEYGSRGLAFILNRSRINVAISRAQCLAIVVADPRIANSSAGSITEMMLLNLYCKLIA